MSSPVELALAELKLEAARAKAAKLEQHLTDALDAVHDAEAELVAALADAKRGQPEPEHSGEVTYAHAERAEGTGRTGLA